ncbi:MAG: YfiR family protein [Desulfobulbaceae bacterium]|nr:YfiR family protein [Desulfobulbaceae bacterium]
MGQYLLKIILCAMLMPLWGATSCLSAAGPEAILEIKASFLLNFMKFTRWPSDNLPIADHEFTLVVLGESPLSVQIKKDLDGQLIKGVPVRVSVYSNLQPLRQARIKPHAIFLTEGMAQHWPQIANIVAGQPVLTMADFSDFCAQGGMLNLVRKEDKIHFEANPEAANSAYLKLNAQLLRLAIIVSTPSEVIL